MQDELETRKQQREQQNSAGLTTPDEESSVPVSASTNTATPGAEETELSTRPNSTTSTRFSFAGRRGPQNGTSSPAEGQLTPRLAELVDAFEKSSMSEQISHDAAAASANAGQANGSQEDGSDTSSVRLQGYKRASLWTQFKILSNRAFKNLYRNPMLMLSHYALSAILASELNPPRPTRGILLMLCSSHLFRFVRQRHVSCFLTASTAVPLIFLLETTLPASRTEWASSSVRSDVY